MPKRPAILLVLIMVSGAWIGWFSGRQLRAPLPARLPVQPAVLAPGESPAERAAEPAAGAPDFVEIVERSLPAVVAVRATMLEEEGEAPGRGERRGQVPPWLFEEPDRRSPVGFGTGFIISPDGYILTNQHVVQGASRVSVELAGGRRYDARVVGTDESIDLALLKVDDASGSLPTLPLGDSNALRVGEWVLAIGNPMGLEHSVTVGVVSAKERAFSIGSTDPGLARFIQTDAAINKGNSGGPLLDARGRVVGINTAIYRGDMANALVEGVSFALPINVARDAVQQILEAGRVERGFLGITMNPQPIDEEMREYFGLPDANGVLVAQVLDGLPAARAGIRPDDIIRAVDGQPLRNNEDLVAHVARKRPGEAVTLEVFRGGESLTFTVRLASRSEGLQRLRGGEARPQVPEVKPPSLGIEVEALSAPIREHLGLPEAMEGVMVRRVDPVSDAAAKGVAPGFVVTRANDEPLRDVEAWERLLRGLRRGDLLKLELYESRAEQRRIVVLRMP